MNWYLAGLVYDQCHEMETCCLRSEPVRGGPKRLEVINWSSRACFEVTSYWSSDGQDTKNKCAFRVLCWMMKLHISNYKVVRYRTLCLCLWLARNGCQPRRRLWYLFSKFQSSLWQSLRSTLDAGQTFTFTEDLYFTSNHFLGAAYVLFWCLVWKNKIL